MSLDAPARRLRLFTSVLLLAAVLLVFGPPLACVLVASRTAGDASRMAMAAVAADLIGMAVSGLVVSTLKNAGPQRSSRALRSALVVARVTFWVSILLAGALSLAALFFWAMAFGLSG